MISIIAATLTIAPLPPTALLISTGDLKGTSQARYSLLGTKNDVQLMANMLTCRFGVPASQIATLGAPGLGYHSLGDRSTRSAIQQAITQWLIKRKGQYGHGILYVSGHAAQSGRLEWLVTEDLKPVMDWEVRNFLRQLKDKNLTIIFDTCHSGGGVRGQVLSQFGTPKFLDNKSLPIPIADPEQGNGRENQTEFSNHTFLAATSRDDVAIELAVQRKDTREVRVFGLFTLAFYQTIMRSNKALTTGSAIGQTNRTMRQMQSDQQADLRSFQGPHSVSGSNTRLLFGGQWTPRYSVSKGSISAGLLAGIGKQQQVFINSKPEGVLSADWMSARVASAKSGIATVRGVPDFSLFRYFAGGRPRQIDGTPPDPFSYQFQLNESGPRPSVTIAQPNGLTSVLEGDNIAPVSVLEKAHETQAEARQLENPDSPFGLSISTGFVSFPDIQLAERDGTYGEKINLTINTTKPVYTCLFSFEPNGTVAWHYPARLQTSSRTTRLGLTLDLCEPEGESIVVAVSTPFPVGLDPKFSVKEDPLGTRILHAQDTPAFFSWLKGVISSQLPFIDRETVDIANTVIRVRMPK